jgi:methylase of polypeptide subunit release factors
VADDDPIGRLGAILVERGFTDAGLEWALAGLEPATAEALRAVHPPGDERLAPLVELFSFGLPVATEEVERALTPLRVSALEAEGVVLAHGGLLTAPLRITPWSGFLLLHDPWGGATLAGDYVGGPTESAETLAHLTVRRVVEAALDLGTGCGLQALLASRHAGRVVASDVNPRALAIARMNARLNRVTNVDFVEGDLFEPLDGRRFDLVVANPPYVISPDSDLLFRDSGLEPGEVCRRVAAGAAAHLNEGGHACMLANWATHSTADRWDAPRSWTHESGCDACTVTYGPEAPLAYAARWSAPPATADAAAYAATVRRWLEFYELSGIDCIWFGALILRRRAGQNWFSGIDLTSEGSGSGSDQIVRIFEAHDYLKTAGELRDVRFEAVPGIRLTHVLEHQARSYSVAEVSVALAEGIGVAAPVDPLALHVLVRLDGRHTLDELVESVAGDRGLDRALLSERSLDCVRRLFELGLLTRRPN